MITVTYLISSWSGSYQVSQQFENRQQAEKFVLNDVLPGSCPVIEEG